MLDCYFADALTWSLEGCELFSMETSADPVQTCEKRRSQAEKVGRLKYIIQLEKDQNKRLDRIECVLRTLEKGLREFLKYEQPYLEQVACKDEIDSTIIEELIGAGSEGMLPKDIAARLTKYKISRWHVSRRLERMNKCLKKEVGQNVAERHGWKWAATSFINENWSADKEEIHQKQNKSYP